MVGSAATARLAPIPFAILENKNPFHYRLKVEYPTPVCSFIAHATGLPKLRIKDALVKGAVWIKRSGQKEKRIRRATFNLQPGDRIDLYYDQDILARTPPSPRLIADEKHYSIWYKPANLLTQGTRYGDHCSLLRLVELYYSYTRQAIAVHRLDREAFGLVIIAHSRKSAAALSKLFQTGQVEKRYLAKVRGRCKLLKKNLRISRKLDGKKAVTIVSDISFSEETGTSTLEILLQTGRYHQIRRHLSQEGYPVIGDPRYGHSQNTSVLPLQLFAYALHFICPFTGEIRKFKLEEPNPQV